MKLFVTDDFRKPDAAKIVVLRRLLFIESYKKVRNFLIAEILRQEVTLASVFLVEPLACAGLAHKLPVYIWPCLRSGC